jgi:hypothetical protein
MRNNITNNTWTSQVQIDKETGELFLPLPIEMLNQLGWDAGTDLVWLDNNNGTFSITNKKPLEQFTSTETDQDIGC